MVVAGKLRVKKGVANQEVWNAKFNWERQERLERGNEGKSWFLGVNVVMAFIGRIRETQAW